MSTQETELPDCQERVGLKRKPTGPPRLLLGKSKSKERLEGKSQRRQREAKRCDSTPDSNDQENNESREMSHQSPLKAPEKSKTLPYAPEYSTGNLVTLEESESKDEHMKSKMEMSRSASKASIKRTFSSLLMCGKRKESEKNETLNPQEAKKNRNDMCRSMSDNKLSDAKNKEVPNGKSKKKVFFMVWPISKRFATSNVGLGKGCKEEGSSSMDFQEIATPKGLTFKKIYRIFPRWKKAPPIDQFECIAPSGSQNEVGDQLNPSPTTAMDNSSIKKEETQKEKQEMKAANVPEKFTFSAEVSVNPNIDSDHIPDQDVSMNREETGGVLDSEVLELPGTSSGADRLVKNKEPIENDVKCRPVITIEQVFSSEEENMNETPQFDGLSVNGSWQHLNINHFSNSTLHPSDLGQSRCNETLLIQTAMSMVQAAIRGAVEQFTIEQQHNQISLEPS